MTTTPPTWTPQAWNVPTHQPMPPQPRRRPGISAIGALTLALVSAGIGGGTALAVNQHLAPVAPALAPATSTSVIQAAADSPDWAATARAVQDAVVAIQVTGASGSGQGSGVIIDAGGHIVTNNHVVSGAGQGARIAVVIGDRSHPASVVGTDPSTDLAVLRLDEVPENLSVIEWGDSAALAVGQGVMAVGNPLGLADTVTTGIISALNRPVTTKAVGVQPTAHSGGDLVVTAAIQTNAAINPGNSGGALVDASGRLIGITSSIAAVTSGADQAGNIGIGFAIPVSQVRDVVDQLIANGVAQHPQLGISARDGLEGTQLGASVDDVSPDSAAAQSGLQRGDLITAVDDAPVVGSESLVALIRTHAVGQEVVLRVLRNGDPEEIRVVLSRAG